MIAVRITAIADYCLGCGLCRIYCAAAHDGFQGNVLLAFKHGNPLPRINLINLPERVHLNVCRHCQDAPCINACISGAMQKDEYGLVYVDHSRCVSCYTCILVCPFGHPQVSHGRPEVLKCDLCRENNGKPACVQHCPNEAIIMDGETAASGNGKNMREA